LKKSQKKILRELAKTHNIPIGVAEEVFHLFIQKIAGSISDPDKKEEGLYTKDKFKTIHIDNFGKFKPNIRNIRHANYCIEKKKNED
jgi:nucleoid DNA-binding protein